MQENSTYSKLVMRKQVTGFVRNVVLYDEVHKRKKKRRFKFIDACVVHKKKEKKKIKMTTEIAQQQKEHKGRHKVSM